MKMLSILAIIVVALGCEAAAAADTISVYGDVGGGLSRHVTTESGIETFDIVIVAETDNPSSCFEFKITELSVLVPGVFRTQITYAGDMEAWVDTGHNEVGEFTFCPGGDFICNDQGQVEVVRMTYLDYEGVMPENVVLSIREIRDGDPTVATFPGRLAYMDCEWNEHRFTRLPWTDYEVIDPTWIPGVESSDGVLVLNPDAIAVSGEESSFGMLKSRY